MNKTQERVERSIFEVLRLLLVDEGYLPDNEDTDTFPNNTTGQDNWIAALKDIVAEKGFGIELFGHSSSQNKGRRKTPRIAIITRRVMPGDIGLPINGGYQSNPDNPLEIIKVKPPLMSGEMEVDIHLVSSTADQDRLLHSILNQSIGILKYIGMYDNPTETFLMKQFNYMDIPDTIDGEEEKVYSYSIPDLYLTDDEDQGSVSTIKEINLTPDLSGLEDDSLVIS